MALFDIFQSVETGVGWENWRYCVNDQSGTRRDWINLAWKRDLESPLGGPIFVMELGMKFRILVSRYKSTIYIKKRVYRLECYKVIPGKSKKYLLSSFFNNMIVNYSIFPWQLSSQAFYFLTSIVTVSCPHPHLLPRFTLLRHILLIFMFV